MSHLFDRSVSVDRNISVGEQFSENRSTVLREPGHGSPRTRAWFSDNRSTTKLENRRTSPCFPSSPRSSCSPRALNLLHVLPSRMVGWNDLCTPDRHYHHHSHFHDHCDHNHYDYQNHNNHHHHSYIESIVGPASKLDVAVLVVKREPSDVNLA